MRRAILCVTVTAFVLMMLSTSVFAFPISLGKSSDPSTDESSESAAKSENIPAGDQEKFDLSQPLTLEQCIEIAKKNASEIKTAKLDLEREEINVRDARSRYLPDITTNGSYMFSDDVDFGWSRDNYNADVAVRYTLWNHGQREGALAQAKSRREGQYYSYNTTGQDLIHNIIKAYYRVLETEELIDVDEQLVELSKQNVKKIEAFVEFGISIEADIATARVQQATEELTLINDENNLELARAELAVRMGMLPTMLVNVIDAPDDEREMQTGIVEAKKIDLEDAISQAFANRSELAEIQASLDILEWAVTLAKLQTWPRITADVGYDLRLSDYLRERDALKNHKGWDASARVSYPIFDGGRTGRILKRADIALMRTNENALELARNVALDVYQSTLNLELARKSLEISRVQVEDAKMSLDVSQGRYDQDMIILLELLDIQTRYARALTNQIKAFYGYKVAERTLERGMGTLQ